MSTILRKKLDDRVRRRTRNSQLVRVASRVLFDRQQAAGTKKQREEYLGFARSFPAFVRRCGLSQAIAFLCQKSEAFGFLYDLSVVLGTTPAQLAVSLNLTDESNDAVGLSDREYRLLTHRVVSAAEVLKKYAEALLETHSGDEPAETNSSRRVNSDSQVSACCSVRKSVRDRSVSFRSAAHAGLILDRYLKTPVPKKINGQTVDNGHSRDRLELLQAAIKAGARATEIYQAAYNRWRSLPVAKEQLVSSSEKKYRSFGRATTEPFDLRCSGRMVTGLGDPSPFEIGIRLHHTYGVPWVPGSALKGLCSHYCDLVWGQRPVDNPTAEFIGGGRVGNDALAFRKRRSGEDPKAVGKFHEILFGTTESAGFITFCDAWIVPLSLSGRDGLVLDVVTPHHTDYNLGKSDDATGDVCPPTDFDSPVPNQYLSVTGTFTFMLMCDSEDDNGSLELTRQLLVAALRNWGVGARTSSGYGRFAGV